MATQVEGSVPNNDDGKTDRHPSKPSSKKKISKSKLKELARQQAVRDAFSQFYADIYGKERWAELEHALLSPTRYSCLINKYADTKDIAIALKEVQSKPEWRSLPGVTGCQCFVVDSDSSEATDNKAEMPFPSPANDFHGVKTHYLLDAASVLATEALDIRPNDKVLDTCAAPGGKSLCILQRLGDGGILHVNEMSVERRKRLRKVLREYLPEHVFEQVIEVFGEDSSRRGSFAENAYDKVLCDAPCSSERHLLHDDEQLKTWSASRTKGNAKRQVPLLIQAIRCAKENGGRIVYATCSLSPQENDMVIEKALRKSKSQCIVRTHERSWEYGEPTKYGWIVLPDRPGRWGPLYFCVIDKAGQKEKKGDTSNNEESSNEEGEEEH